MSQCKEFGKEYEAVDPKNLGIKKRITLCHKDGQWIVVLKRKSRVLQKDAKELVEAMKGKRVTIYIDAPLCSKAKKLFEDAGWRVNALM
ncbi:hypothetical protein [Nitratiruptor sp. YY09-18]|uniref:hypothetical protein n=1 Tax=Nitratiruptor sp. YY09-18 TaxID=2724901 RepID=UPI00191528A6|nr:hypothetical protein [Nitratiruptor sp. YY09-18]BCD67828.1 hypothetical protein NitYY0918_C0735 [Nitratiruptor sp. YY09-18]